MALCKFSSEFISNNSVMLDNSFIAEFMPNAPENCVKVYLFGLLKCFNPDALDNSLEGFSKVLNISSEDIFSSFLYWQELGIVQVISKEPLDIRYMPVRKASTRLMKFNVDKYKDFNIKAQELLSGRMITPTEYQEYYYLIESLHLEKDAMIMIIKHCVSLKGNNINYPYILTVAKNWAYDGILTCEAVENRLIEQERSSGIVLDIMKALGLKRGASNEEYELYLKWTKELEIEPDIIIYLAKKQKGKSGGINRLNSILEKCYSLKLSSIKEIQAYLDNQNEYLSVAKEVCKNLGVRYDNLENVVDVYISNWFALGFDGETIKEIANYCFKIGIKNLEGMNNKIDQLFKMGLLTINSLNSYLEEIVENDSKIKEILERLGIERAVITSDRNLYKTWLYTWNISTELLDFAIENSVDKYMPLQYLNKLLSSYYIKGIKTVEDAKKQTFDFGGSKRVVKENKKPEKRNYTAKELNGLFDNVFEVEV